MDENEMKALVEQSAIEISESSQQAMTAAIREKFRAATATTSTGGEPTEPIASTLVELRSAPSSRQPARWVALLGAGALAAALVAVFVVRSAGHDARAADSTPSVTEVSTTAAPTTVPTSTPVETVTAVTVVVTEVPTTQVQATNVSVVPATDPPPTTPTTLVDPVTISITKGASAAGQPGCSDSSCRFVTVTASGLVANTTYTRKCYGTNGWWSVFSITTDSSGGFSESSCYYGSPDTDVYVTIGTHQSNTIHW